MKRFFISFYALLTISLHVQADEGMWIPMLLEQLNESEMIDMGLEITAEDIYSINKSSLKDAIVHFGGGCTAEMISGKGLLLTNHHCGYGEIQSHSSVENDYLTDGFWAKSLEEELSNPGLTATFIKYMDDVTESVLKGTSEDMELSEQKKIIRENMDAIIEEAIADTHYEAKIKPFFKGNKYYMFVTETFKDVRLVGAPPSSIGKYGADTDNWVWPRHTGDFSIFRIYADKDNKPAEYSEDNVPYKPAHHLPVSIKGIEEGDFTMVFGFPGRTNEYLPSSAIDQTLNLLNPAKIDFRQTSLGIMDKKMRRNDKTRIQYAAKYASIANYYKKWIGENTGLKESRALDKKRKLESKFQSIVDSRDAFSEYRDLLPSMKATYDENEKYALARDLFVETAYYNISSMRFCFKILDLERSLKESEEEASKAKNNLINSSKNYFKNLDQELDQNVLAAIIKMHPKYLAKNMYPELFDEFISLSDEKYAKTMSSIYSKSLLMMEGEFQKLEKLSPEKAYKKLSKDPIYKIFKAYRSNYYSKVRPTYNANKDKLEVLMKKYMKAQMEVFSDQRFYPDANSTLRLTYGTVQGMSPKDAVDYHFITNMDGLMAKYIPGDYEFDLPKGLIELYNNKDYGQYAAKDGTMPVCFIASNHTTGGNSGSPALNSKGELIGLNFDRAWEGTMSDINYDVSRCRNIMVDIRYVLFIIDKFAGAGYLVEEMDLVK
jgi:hypothetical protein